MQRWARDQLVVHDNQWPYHTVSRLERIPVTIEEFVRDGHFLGSMDDYQVWPEWWRELGAMCPDLIVGEQPKEEVYLGGGSGTGKTDIAKIILAYHIYLLTCFRRPTDPFPGLSGMTPVVFPIMTHQFAITRDIIYAPLRSMLTMMPYMQRHTTWDKNRDSSLIFTSHNIHVTPMHAMESRIKGQAICGALVDELTSMQVIEHSKQTPGDRGLGGRFDQAAEVHQHTRNRRWRSFKSRGINPGALCFLGQARYEGDFMDRWLATMERDARPSVYHRRLKRYEMNPEDVAEMRAGRTIRVLVGAPGYSSRVLEDGERAGRDYPRDARVETVPEVYEHLFRDDPDMYLREICGISTGVISPFLAKREKIAAAFRRGRRLRQWVDEPNVRLSERDLPEWLGEVIAECRGEHQHYVHVDLSTSKDRCGIAVVRVSGLEYVQDPDNPDTPERVPHLEVVAACSIQPTGTSQIDPAEIRTWLMELGTLHDVEIGGVSYDGYQSKESQGRWRAAGTRVAEVGTDRTTEVYDQFRTALYQDRVDIVANGILSEELHDLEYHAEKDRVDHPPKGSKDIADAVACACWMASNSRAIRGQVGYVDADTGERVRVRRPQGRRSGRERPRGRRRRTA